MCLVLKYRLLFQFKMDAQLKRKFISHKNVNTGSTNGGKWGRD